MLKKDAEIADCFGEQIKSLETVQQKWELIEKLQAHSLKKACVQRLSKAEVLNRLFENLDTLDPKVNKEEIKALEETEASFVEKAELLKICTQSV